MIEFKQMLCPVDLSEASARSLDHAIALAQRYDAHLTVLHVVPTLDPVYVAGELGAPVQIVNPIAREQVLENVRRSVDLSARAPGANLVTEAGDASTTIVNQAVSTRDLIVMGTHGRRGFKRLFLGSVTETVLREAPCPVLTVPPAVQAAPSEAATFKRILCPVDYSPSALQALGFALDLARQSDGRITLLHVVEWLAEDEPRTQVHFNVPEYRRYFLGSSGRPSPDTRASSAQWSPQEAQAAGSPAGAHGGCGR